MVSLQFMAYLFLTMSPVELSCDAAEPWQLGSQDAATPMMQGIIDLPHDVRCILVSFLVSSCLSFWKNRFYWYRGSRSCMLFLIFLLLLSLSLGLGLQPTIAYSEGSNAFTPPPSPPQLPEEPVPPAEGPPVPPAVVIPQLVQPLLSDEMRSSLLYSRYLLLNLGGSDDPGRMVSIIDAQIIVERHVEAALVNDGFPPHSILAKYREIRGLIHAPQGALLSPRTYQSYVTQIQEHGTRASIPYRRIIRAIQNYDLLLERE